MDADWVLATLNDVMDALEEAIAELESDPDAVDADACQCQPREKRGHRRRRSPAIPGQPIGAVANRRFISGR
jgi:hypothetical protein